MKAKDILYLRNFPLALKQEARSKAALAGISLTQFVIDAVKAALANQPTK